MKELIIHVKIDKVQTATVIKRNGFDKNISSSYEVIGILQNLIKLEQDKMETDGTTISKSLI